MGYTLTEGQQINPGDAGLVSPNGKFQLYLTNGQNLKEARLYRFDGNGQVVTMWPQAVATPPEETDASLQIIKGHFVGVMSLEGRQYWAWSHPDGNAQLEPHTLVLQDDGNLVHYASDQIGIPTRWTWSTRTNGSYPAAVVPAYPVAVMVVGTIAINANTILANQLGTPINVYDGATAATLQPQQSVGVVAPQGAGSVAITTVQFAYDRDAGSSSATARPNVKTSVSGNVVNLVAGAPAPFDLSQYKDHNFLYQKPPLFFEVGGHKGVKGTGRSRASARHKS